MHLTPSLRKLKLQVLMLFIRQSVLTLRGADSRQASAILWSTRWALSTCTSSEDILSGYKYTYSAVILWLNKNIQIYPAVMEIGHQNYQFWWKFLKSVTKKNCPRKYSDTFFLRVSLLKYGPDCSSVNRTLSTDGKIWSLVNQEEILI